jgi:diguanylate cyclase (GGDEF)-like protein
MDVSSLVALHLAGGPTHAPLDLKPVFERADALIDALLPTVEPEPRRVALASRRDTFRDTLVAATTPEQLAALTPSCVELCADALRTLAAQQQDGTAELRRLVALLRETVTAFAGEGDGVSADMMHERRVRSEQTVRGLETQIMALERQVADLRDSASTDPLTGVANRRRFDEALRHATASGSPLAVAMLDLDGFKRINDTGGHAAGDAILRAVANALTGALRQTDLVARLGGDEFALLLSNISLRQADARLRAIVSMIGGLPTGLMAHPHVTASCGLVEYCAGDTPESVVRRADLALYEAKRQGKHRVVVQSPPLIRDLLRKLARQ